VVLPSMLLVSALAVGEPTPAVWGTDWGVARFGVGALTFAENGLDLQLQLRIPGVAIAVGWRYARWDDTFMNPYSEEIQSRTHEELTGPTVYWLLRPERATTFFVGGEILRASRRVNTFPDGAQDESSLIAPMVGGGWQARLGPLHAQIGLFLSVGKKLKTVTALSSEENVVFDAQLQLGICL